MTHEFPSEMRKVIDKTIQLKKSWTFYIGKFILW